MDLPTSSLLEAAFARHHSELLGTLFYLLGNVHDAQDALQEAFVRAWPHRDKLAEVANVRAWLFRVVLNTGRDLRDSAWRRRRESLNGADDMTSTLLGPDQQLLRDEELGQFRRALLSLSPPEQEVFLLRQNGELTYEEIAESVGAPVGTVKTRMRTALQKLREAVEQ